MSNLAMGQWRSADSTRHRFGDPERRVLVGGVDPHPPVVAILTTFQLDEYVFPALEAGASGFLLKDTPPREILATYGPSPDRPRSLVS